MSEKLEMSWCPKYIVPLGRPVQTSQQIQQCALAGARFADQREAFAGCDIEVQIVKHHQIGSAGSELLGQIDAAESAGAIGVHS